MKTFRFTALLVFLLSCAFTEAVITWDLPAVSISSPGEDAGSAQVVLDNQGNAVSIWTRFDGVNYIVQGATFVNATQAWTPPLDLSLAGQNAEDPALSINASGKVVAVWSRFDGTNSIIQSATTETQLGLPNTWSSTANISVSGTNAAAPQIGVDTTGDAVAVWEVEVGSGETNIQSASLVASVWQAPTIISQPGESAVMPQIAVNPSGTGIAVWRRCNGLNGIIQAAVYTSGWSASVDLSAIGESASIPKVGIDDSGAAIAIWRRSNGTNYIIQASHFIGGVWQSPADLSATTSNSDSPAIAVQLDGQAFATWSFEQSSLVSVIQGSQSNTASGVWTTPLNFTTTGNSVTPHVGIFQDEAVIIWSTSSCPQGSVIQAASVNLTDDTIAPITTLFNLTTPADEPFLAINAAGNVIATWRGFSTDDNLIWSLRGSFAVPAICIDSSTNSGPTSGGNVVILTGTNLLGATAVDFGAIPALSFTVVSDTEIQATAPAGSPGTVTIFVHTPAGTSAAETCNIYTYLANPPSPPNPPVITVLKQTKNKFLTQTELINVIKWAASTTPGVTSYHVYRDGLLVAEVLADQPLVFVDHNRRPGITYVYAVTALIGNSESQPTVVIISEN